jgi:type III pantothenate kinase
MLLLIDIGNTNTHFGLANSRRVLKQFNIKTADWFNGSAARTLGKITDRMRLQAAALCSVVPRATPRVIAAIKKKWKLDCFELTAETVRGVGIDYPKPRTIGPDRLANAVAGRHRFGSPVLIIDFGTAVTFDVVDRRGKFIGGVIAPGLASMTDYLHEKTALLPRIKIRQTRSPIGRSTEQALLAGVLYGYRGLVRDIIRTLKGALRTKRLPIVATGGYGRLMAARLPEIHSVEPLLTLEGLRLVWQSHQPGTTLKR